MITWNNFHLFAIVSIVLWLIGATFALRSSKRSRAAIGLTSAGVLVLGVFIVGLWMFLQWVKLAYGIPSSWESQVY